jgi:hypothetical protein
VIGVHRACYAIDRPGDCTCACVERRAHGHGSDNASPPSIFVEE